MMTIENWDFPADDAHATTDWYEAGLVSATVRLSNGALELSRAVPIPYAVIQELYRRHGEILEMIKRHPRF